MRLKSFYAKTLKDAMQTIKDTLGEDAVIVSSRDDPRGGGVHVTAAMDDSPLGAPIGERQDWLQYDDERDTQSIAEEITDLMLFHNVPEAVIDEVISFVTVSGYDSAIETLTEAFTHLFFFDRLSAVSHKRPLVLVGPCGCGKTSVVARLAARASMAGEHVSVITADSNRAGASSQLKAFTDLLDVKLQQADGPKKLSALITKARAGGAQQIIIDTAGANPFDTNDMRELAAIIKAAQGDTVLALPAGMDTDEAGEAARIFAAAGARRFLPTRLDCARRLGSLLAAAHKGGITFVGASASSSVASGITELTPHSLADILLNGVSTHLNAGVEKELAKQDRQDKNVGEGAI